MHMHGSISISISDASHSLSHSCIFFYLTLLHLFLSHSPTYKGQCTMTLKFMCSKNPWAHHFTYCTDWSLFEIFFICAHKRCRSFTLDAWLVGDQTSWQARIYAHIRPICAQYNLKELSVKSTMTRKSHIKYKGTGNHCIGCLVHFIISIFIHT